MKLAAELCKCGNHSENWKDHAEYCPVWKNGRICELESISKDLVDGVIFCQGDEKELANLAINISKRFLKK